jgi:hypothetical protein
MLPYLYTSFIISFKYLFDEKIILKLFLYYFNPYLEQILVNELSVLKVLGFNLYAAEEKFNKCKGKLI